MNGDDTCSQHLGLALSCGKIEEIHEAIKRIEGNQLRLEDKQDQFGNKLNNAIATAFKMQEEITEIRTSKEERWNMQKWWNVTLAGGFIAVAFALWVEWMKFHG